MRLTNNTPIPSGSDCKQLFKEAYENRYTWDERFLGYKGKCSFQSQGNSYEGFFSVDKNFKVEITDISDENANKAISSQLWEVSIHRVRRSFDQTHGQNTFVAGDTNEIGTEVIVGGKNKGDKYRIRDNVVTMVSRNIHGSLIQIFTESITDTGQGYLSKSYTSQYFDPVSLEPTSGLSYFRDTFSPLFESGPWVLSERIINKKDLTSNSIKELFQFNSLEAIA